MIRYTLIEVEGQKSVTAFIGGELLTTTGDNPNFDEIVRRLLAQDESAADLFDYSRAASTRFERLSERVTVANGRVFFDGDEVDNSLSKQIVRFINEGHDFTPLVNFMENVASNPNEHSREQLYRWLQGYDFTITEDGCFIGYKGVRDDLTSIHSGTATVNGEVVNGFIPNQPGSVIEMPRSDVAFDPTIGCSYGLHVGTWGYANDFGTVTLKVKVNPRDVVSVPTDCNAQKVRVCRYTVIDEVERELESGLWNSYSADEPDYDEDGRCEDPDCWCNKDEDPKFEVNVMATSIKAVNDDASDTRFNYRRQQRDANGRFVKRV